MANDPDKPLPRRTLKELDGDDIVIEIRVAGSTPEPIPTAAGGETSEAITEEIHKQPTIEEKMGPAVPALQARGWHVVLAKDEITLHSFFKNGKPRRGADVSLAYQKFKLDNDYNFETGEIFDVERLNTRPYCVRSKRMDSGKAFAVLARAVEAFMIEAAELAIPKGTK